MQNIEIRKTLQKGSLMIEALALLGLISMVTPVMYKKAAERTTELHDINLATQMRTINDALDNYIRDHYSEYAAADENVYHILNEEEGFLDELKKYLPAGFEIEKSKYFDVANLKYSFRRNVLTGASGSPRSTYTTAVLAPSINEVNRTRTSKIASMIGVNGGMFDKAAESGTPNIMGTQGAWSGDIATMFNGVTVSDLKQGTLVTISDEVISESVGGAGGGSVDNENVLFRKDVGDPDKNTMVTDLVMGQKEGSTDRSNIKMNSGSITGIAALFGSGGTVNIGNDTDEENLVVSGASKLVGAVGIGIENDLPGISLLVDGKTTMNDDLTVKGATVINKTLDVKDDTILEGALEAKGTSHLKGNVSIGSESPSERTEKLFVEGDTTVTGKTVIGTDNATIGNSGDEKLVVEGDTLLDGMLEVADGAKIGNNGVAQEGYNLNVLGNEYVSGNLKIDETLDANNLHARTKLSVGGDDPASPSVLSADASAFKVKINNNKLNLEGGSFLALASMDGTDDTPGGEFRITGEKGTIKMKAYSSSTASMEGEGGKFEVGGNSTIGIHAKVGAGDTAGTVFEANSDSTKLQSYKNEGAYSSLTLSDTGAVLQNVDSADSVEAYLILNGDNNFRVGANDFYIDDDGLAIGTGDMGQSGGDYDYIRDKSRAGLDDPVLVDADEATDPRRVVISRKGYIDIAPPTDNYGGSDDGHSMGFIRARRLVSDVPYVSYDYNGVDAFSGTDVNGHTSFNKYEYYEVNPAYTSVMNDIKLASRGGARLSDILPDYIVKGIYVADNTYHLNNKKGDDDHDYTEHKVTDGQVDMSDDKGPVSCTSPACPTSPWLGYIPLPHCPKNYQMSITFAPYRWRMAELYRVTDGNDPNTNPSIEDFMGDASTTKNIFSGNAINKDGEDEGYIPRNKYFEKPDDKVLDQSYRTIETNSADASLDPKHAHSVTEPITLQVNTWLNSTVMERELNPGSDERIIGWDVLMGFLSRGTEYENIINKMGYKSGDPDTTYWNIFPVYAQDLAGIATVYCGFNRHPLVSSPSRDNVWGAGLEGSPVIDYEQLDPDRYRDVLNYSRNPVSNANGTPGTNWSKAVNDPTLKYDDAW